MKKFWMFLPAVAFLLFGITIPKAVNREDNVNRAGAGSVFEVSVDTFDKLKEALVYEEDSRITVTSDIEITDTINVGEAQYTIVADKDITFTRAEGMTGDMFYISGDSSLTLSEMESTYKIAIDGNGAIVANAEGSVFDNRGELNIYDGVSISNVSGAVSGSVIYSSGDCVLEKVSIYDNTIDVGGAYGMIYSNSGSSLILNDCEMYNNQTARTSGATMFINTGSTARINGGKYYSNTAGTRGGVIALKASDLTIKGAVMYDNTADYGGAIHSYEGAKLNIGNSEFYGNLATHMGGAVSSVGATITATNVNMHENTANSKGGAIYVEGQETNPVTLTINGGKFDKNTALNAAGTTGYGGAVFVTNENSKVSIIGADFTENRAVYGGGIYVEGADGMIINGNVTKNTAQNEEDTTGYGGGLYFNKASDITIHSVKIAENHAKTKGGAINISGEANLTMFDSKIYSNTSTYGAGVGVENGTFVQESGEIMYNVSSASGCGVFVDKGSYTLNDGKLSFNKTTGANGGGINNKDKVYINGGTIEGNSATWYGGAIHSYISDTSDDVQVIISGGTFKDNGKALTIDGESATVGDPIIYGGGAVNINSGILKITGGTFINNATAQNSSGKYGYGGAINASGGEIIISGGTFDSNTAAGRGGALHAAEANLTINGGTFTGNSTTAASTNGGAIYLTEMVDTTINAGMFSGNTAKGNAGALYLEYGTATINGGTFTANSANYGGALGVYLGGHLIINGGKFYDNIATSENRGSDAYIYGSSGSANDALLTVNGGSFDNIGFQYARVSIGGDFTVKDRIKVWAGKQAAYAHFIIHDIIKNPVTLDGRWFGVEGKTDAKQHVRISPDCKVNPYRLLDNINFVASENSSTNAYLKYHEDTRTITTLKATYDITTPEVLAITVDHAANEGASVSFRAITGYNVSNVKYNGTELTAVDGVYTFTMPASDVAITYDVELAPIDIIVNSEAKGLIELPAKATLESTVEVSLIPSTAWVVDNVYYEYNGEKIYLDYRKGKYSFTMFEGVEIFVEKTPLYYISFASASLLSNESTAKVDGEAVVSTLAGETVNLEILANDFKYLPDLDNSYYLIAGDATKYSVKDLSFTMPAADVMIYTTFINIYSSLENIVEVDNFTKLKETLTNNVNADIILTEDIEVSETIELAKNTSFTIVASGNKTLKRAAGFTKTLFALPEFTTLKLGLDEIPDGVECELVIDGNGGVVTSAVGSLFAVINSSELVINDCVKLTNNKVNKNEYGTIIGRVSSNAGGGAVMLFNGKLIMNGGEISYNSAKGYGGAIYGYGFIEMNDGKITNNTTTSHGGAIFTNRIVRINGGEISYNSVTSGDANGGAIYATSNNLTVVTITGGRFEGNTAKASAGALYVGVRANITINGGEFVNNKSTTGNAGAMYLYGKAMINNATFSGNYAKGNGAAIYVNTGDDVIFGQLYLYGGVFENNRADYGGGAIAVHRNSTLYMDNSTAIFRDNYAKERGGAIYLASDSDVTPAKAIVLNGTFDNNTSGNGNDIAIQYGVLELGGTVSYMNIQTVANPTEYRGYIKFVAELENEIKVMPISYIADTITGDRVFRIASGVSVENILEKVNIKQPSGATYFLSYSNGLLTLRKRTFLVNIADGLDKAITMVSNADAGETITIAVKQGYTVTDLKVDGVAIEGNKFTMPAKDVEVTYVATLINYTVAVAEELTGGQLSVDKTTATIKDTVTITVTPEAGYFVTALYVNGKAVEVTNNTATIAVNANTNITASFEKAVYMVCYNYNYDNKTEMKSVVAGSTIKEITPSRKGYTFEGWFTDKQLTQAYNFEEGVYGVLQLYAKWTEK